MLITLLVFVYILVLTTLAYMVPMEIIKRILVFRGALMGHLVILRLSIDIVLQIAILERLLILLQIPV